ncbi:MAG: DNA-binding protein [Prevotella sp.]|nr:DNA-binding protein [Prevotella sp.]
MALKFQLVKKTNPREPQAEKLWYGNVRHENPIMELDDLAKHMSEHNSPYSKGLIKGILTDMVSCIKEKVLEGFKVKINDLAIFSLKVKSKGEANAKDWTVQKNITNVHLNARATGEFTIDNLKGATLVESPDYKSPRREEETSTPDTPVTPEDPGTGGGNEGGGNEEW